MAAAALPTGQRGQALALGLTAVVLAAIWFGAVAPALQWYAGRTEFLQQQRQFATRMTSVAATAPALQAQLAAADAAPPPRSVFEGATDAIAGAALQQAIQDIAARTGAVVLSAEVLAVQPVAGYGRIGVRMTVSAPWPQLVALLQATLDATPRMLVDDLTIRQNNIAGGPEQRPLEAAFTVDALHAAPPPTAAAGTAAAGQ